LFDRPPADNYEYINPCKYARSSTAAGSDTPSGSSDDDDDDDANSDSAYKQVPPSRTVATASSKRLCSQPAQTVASSFPGHDSGRTAAATEDYANIKSRPGRRNEVQRKETKQAQATGSLSPANKQRSGGDDFVYEVLENLLPSLTVKAAGKPGADETGSLTKTSRSQYQTDAQRTRGPPAGAQPTNKPPPPTKPKSFKRQQAIV